MKILIINKYGKGILTDSNILPRIGDSIDMFYRPFPIVKSVLLWPSVDTLGSVSTDAKDVDAIVTVE